jgi:hypothetical protein|tara:strand:+ start:991 stop:1299 length:309 start_codon:yes stop_codon:yes gene_type:complete
MKKDDNLTVLPDNGQTKMWASQGYANMLDDSHSDDITYNVNMRWLRQINNIKPGDLVATSEEETALVLELVSRDMQGFDVYKVLVDGKEFLYSALELSNIGE